MDDLTLKKTQVDIQLLRYIILLLNISKEELMEIKSNSENTNQSRFTPTRRHKTGYVLCLLGQYCSTSIFIMYCNILTL
jgi:hypothetical protein